MIGLDVVHDRDGGVQREEGLVVLVGLDHEERRRRRAARCRPSCRPGRPRARSDASPAAASASVVMTVVVVLPCVPAIPTTVRARPTSSASASFRGTTGMPSSRAPRPVPDGPPARPRSPPRRGRPPTCAGSWPCRPRRRARRDRRHRRDPVSQPLTATPRRRAMRARALIPAPPMPTKCTGRGSRGVEQVHVELS